MFQKEIEVLRDRYNEERQTPMVPRNIPPVSGRIMWIRHFYSRIEEPMHVFRTKQRVSKKITKMIRELISNHRVSIKKTYNYYI